MGFVNHWDHQRGKHCKLQAEAGRQAEAGKAEGVKLPHDGHHKVSSTFITI